jgi:hypothetical protein
VAHPPVFKKEWPVLSRSPILTNRSSYEPYHRSVPIPAEGWFSLAGLREIVPGRCLTARPHTPWRRAARAKTRMQEEPWTCGHQKKDRLGSQIGIGGRLTTPPLPHHRTYGSRIRRFEKFR